MDIFAKPKNRMRMEFWEKHIPAYLTDKGNIVRTVIFTALFALLFINIYAPFGVNAWFEVTRVELFFYSSVVILAGVMVVVISRIIMYRLTKSTRLQYWHYGLWIFLEIVCMAFAYVVIEKLVLKDSRTLWDAFQVSLQNTALIILLPYFVLWLYFSWRDKNEKLQQLMEQGQVQGKGRKMVPFHDERGVLKFSVKEDDIYFLEAADNYVTINYFEKDKITYYLLRSTLKKLEDSLQGTSLYRCHRSYMVNADKVKLIKKEKDGLFIQLDLYSDKAIPLSKTYADHFLKEFAGIGMV